MALFLVVCAPGAAAQREVAPEVLLTGNISDASGTPIASALVGIQRAGGVTDSTFSGTDGVYRLPLRASGGEYLLTVRHAGFITASMLVEHRAGVRMLRQDVRLSRAPASSSVVALEELVVAAPRQVPISAPRANAPGESTTANFAFSAQLFPVEPGDLAGTAALTPGVLPSGAGGVSIAGQPASQNRTTLDGAEHGAQVPSEAVAAAGVIVHPYDVSRGQFTGGEIAATTRSGTNVWGGSASLSVSDPRLQTGVSGGDRAGAGQLSTGGGGPLVRNRAFVYGAAQMSLRRVDASGLGDGYAALPADSVRRLGEILRGLGVPMPEGEAERGSASASALTRLDLLAGNRHLITVRLDGRTLRTTGIGSSAVSLSPPAELRDHGGGALVQLRSDYRAFVNQLHAHVSRGARSTHPAFRAPTGRVHVAGAAADPAAGATFQFGGSLVPETRATNERFEFGNRFIVPLAEATHQIQVGGSYTVQRVSAVDLQNRDGTFEFATLRDLEVGRPSAFTRTLSATERSASTVNAALFAGDTWKAGERLRLLYGVRAERRGYPESEARSPLVDSLFGRTAGKIPSEWGVSPRFGFNYAHSRFAGVKGGVGEFRGSPPLQALAGLLSEAGVDRGTSSLSCFGPAAPVPEWGRYAIDPAAIPAICAEGAPVFSARTPTAAGFAPGYTAPRIWQASISTHLGTPRFSLAVDATLSRGAHNALARDVNFNPRPQFFLSTEGGRPVYVIPSEIDTVSGRVGVRGARFVPELGTVREIDAVGRSRTWQVVLDGTWQMRRGYLAAAYVHTRSLDQSGGMGAPGAGLGSTSGDPRMVEWGPRDFEQRHALTFRASRFPSRKLQFTVIGYFLSGVPFSPLVDVDINGDGLANDRAFIFDPASAPTPELGSELDALSARLPRSSRACLLRQIGSVADRNSCRTPWSSTVNAQFNFSPGGGQDRRLRLAITAQNLTGGLDRLLHGTAGLRGWGRSGYDLPDPVLLRVRGFDPAAGRFRYEVNPGFGAPYGGLGRTSSPFALRIEARVAVGADPATQVLTQMVNEMSASSHPAEIRAHFLRHLRNVPAQVLASADSLGLRLSTDQMAGLIVSADSLAPRLAEVTDLLVEALSMRKSGGGSAQEIDDLTRRGLVLVQTGVQSARSLLTPQQWGKLPRRLRARPVRIPRPAMGPPSPF
jgi:hypothetical protein